MNRSTLLSLAALVSMVICSADGISEEPKASESSIARRRHSHHYRHKKKKEAVENSQDAPSEKKEAEEETQVSSTPRITEKTREIDAGKENLLSEPGHRKVKKRPIVRKKREPFKISPEFKAEKEEIEPPEIKVTCIIQSDKEMAALAKLEFEKCEGTVVLEPSTRVSIPKPNRLKSDKWMTYFTVTEISRTGITIVLENGEKVWYPVMGEID